MRLPVAICLALISAPAAAEWRVTSAVDAMTDKAFATASVTSGPASLVVTCRGPELRFDSAVAFGEMGVNYRLDNGPLQPRIAPMSSDGRTVHLWLGERDAARKIAGAKRLRVEVFPTGGQRQFIDFDLTGAKEAVAQIKCGS